MWLDQVREWVSANVSPQAIETTVEVLSFTALIIVASIAWSYTVKGAKKLGGYYKMKKRERSAKEFREIAEDIFVEGLSQSIELKKITIDEARMLYAKLAHFGLWGLHPRKFTPVKTPEELEKLKEQLRAKKAAREGSNKRSASSVVSKMLDGVDEEFN